MYKYRSDCHTAKMIVRGDSFGEGTNYYECLECHQPCTPVDLHTTPNAEEQSLREKIRDIMTRQTFEVDSVRVNKMVQLIETEKEKAYKEAYKQGELYGVSCSNDAYHDLTAPELGKWLGKEMWRLEKALTTKVDKGEK